jgi:hypothetical protein
LRRETRARVRAACRAVGGSDLYCAIWDAVAARESSYRAGARHTIGEGEHGLGVFGLSLRWHADKWPGDDEDPAWCTPEAAFAVAHAIAWAAVTRYHATNAADVQAVFAGRWRCRGEGATRRCQADPTPRGLRAICGRLEARGWSCWAPLRLADLGQRLPRAARRSWAELQAARWADRAGADRAGADRAGADRAGEAR